jgi:hypothetical protein
MKAMAKKVNESIPADTRWFAGLKWAEAKVKLGERESVEKQIKAEEHKGCSNFIRGAADYLSNLDFRNGQNT